MSVKYPLLYYSLVTMLLLMASCGVGAYVTPNADVPDRFGRTDSTTIDSTSVADLRWNDFFKNQDLQFMINKGIENNFDMLIAYNRILAAQEKLKGARMLTMPSAYLNVSAQSITPSENSLNGISLNNFLGQSHIEDFDASINIGWEADIWGKIKAQKSVALNKYLQTFEAKKAVQTQLVYRIAESYYNLLMLAEQLDIAKRNLILTDTILHLTQLQYNAGIVTNLAVKQAAAQKHSINVLIPQLEQNMIIQENALSILTGSTPNKIIRTSRLLDIPLPDILQLGVPAGLLARRPDIQYLEMEVRARHSEVKVSQASMYPAWRITASGGLNSFLISNWFQTPASLFANVLGGITQPLLQRRTLKTNLEVSKLEREKAVLEFRQSVLNAIAEVSDALARTQKLSDQFSQQRQEAETLQLALNDSKQLFQSGLANYLEVIIVQRNVLQAQLALASIRRQQLTATVDLYRSLGGGWQ